LPAPEAAAPARDLIGLTVSDGVAELVLRRDDGANALSPALLAALDHALGEVQADASVKLLVLRGEGRCFSTGVDLAAVEALPPGDAREFFERGRALIRRLEGLSAITLAAVNGLALGGGFELVLACDVRWTHARAVFAFPECQLGLIPGWGGVRLLRRHLPSSLAFELLTRGDRLGARAAHGYGLVSRIFEGKDFQGQVRAGLEMFRGRDAAVLRAIKTLSLELAAGSASGWNAAEAAALDALWSRRAARSPEAASPRGQERGS
jgi:enoyl-CoA hydratase/carnithine racemase